MTSGLPPYLGQHDDSSSLYGSAAGSRAYASFWQRLGAIVIDGVILLAVDLALNAALKGVGAALGVACSAAYFTYFEGSRGQTPGKNVLGIKVVSKSDGNLIGFSRAFVRWAGRYVSSIVILLGYFWMLWDPECQCWHDKFANSVVVRYG